MGAGAQTQKLTASDGAEFDNFGASVSISGDVALVGASGDDDHGRNTGSAYVFTRGQDGSWIQTQKLTSDDGAEDDQFGVSVSISGDVALVGAYFDDDHGSNSGSAYLFTRGQDGRWTQTRKLTADDGARSDWFGRSVSVSGDMALVGAYGDDERGIANGSAHFFALRPNQQNNNPMLQQTQGDRLRWRRGRLLRQFGVQSAVTWRWSGPMRTMTGPRDSGSAYVFTRGEWDLDPDGRS
jgi:hypothetical protein